MKKGIFVGLLLALALLCVGCASKSEKAEAQELASTSSFTSPKTYYVKVNLQKNVVTVYKKDSKGHFTVPYKAMRCSDGKETPTGTYDISWTGRWRWLGLVGGVCGQYCTQITGDYLFHSVPYTRWYDHSSLQKGEYDKLGTTCSHGCIRLTVADARWIYNHKNDIARVKLYKSSDPGPLGKPVTQKISDAKYKGWDPTDPVENNPWRNAKVKVGTYTGLKKDSAVIALKKAGLRAKIVYKYSSKTKGNVIAQSSKSGTSVKWSSTITLTVSKGPAPVKVGYYVGMKKADAVAAAQKAGLTVKIAYKYSAKTKGNVIRQSLAKDESVKKGTCITLTVSKGPAPVTVESYVGMTSQEAIAAVQKLGLTAEVRYVEGETPDMVLEQSVEPGTSIAVGSTVVLTVSQMTEPIEEAEMI